MKKKVLKKSDHSRTPTEGRRKKIVMVSGGFDPVHIGHVRLFKEAKKLGDELVVYINNDHWLRAKKGYAFMPDYERKEIIEHFKPVDRVIVSGHKKNTKDMSVCMGLIQIKPHIFANGGDRDERDANDPKSSLYKERQIHKKLGIKMVYNVGRGGKVRSSSALLREHVERNGKKK